MIGTGTWSAESPWEWTGSVVCAELSVAVAFASRGTELAWAKAKPRLSHTVRILLHPVDAEGGVQPIVYLEGGLLGRDLRFRLLRPERPPAPVRWSEHPRPHLGLDLEAEPPARVEVLFLPKSAVRVGRNHLWRLKPEHGEGLSERHREALRGGRSGLL